MYPIHWTKLYRKLYKISLSYLENTCQDREMIERIELYYLTLSIDIRQGKNFFIQHLISPARFSRPTRRVVKERTGLRVVISQLLISCTPTRLLVTYRIYFGRSLQFIYEFIFSILLLIMSAFDLDQRRNKQLHGNRRRPGYCFLFLNAWSIIIHGLGCILRL